MNITSYFGRKSLCREEKARRAMEHRQMGMRRTPNIHAAFTDSAGFSSGKLN
jgi:hypothetical protein